MTIYVNTAWTVRDYETTNVRFQITDELPRNMNGTINLENWKPLTEAEHTEAAVWEEFGSDYLQEMYSVEPLGGFARHRFYGHM